MRLKLGYKAHKFQVTQLDQDPHLVRIRLDDEDLEMSLNLKESAPEGRVEIDGKSLPYFVTHDLDFVWVTLGGQTFCFQRMHGDASEPEADAAGFQAPMPGKVLDVLVSEGDEVAKGDVLVILEAMKMEHRMEAPGAGTITSLFVKKGQLVSQNFKILDFQLAD